MTAKINRGQLMRKMHAMLNELGMMKHKQAWLTGYGVSHASDLSDQDLHHLVNRLDLEKAKLIDAKTRKLRSTVLTILQKLGIYENNNDWQRVNEYLSNPRISGKLLPAMSHKELEALIKKLNAILTKKENEDARIRRLASNN